MKVTRIKTNKMTKKVKMLAWRISQKKSRVKKKMGPPIKKKMRRLRVTHAYPFTSKASATIWELLCVSAC